MKLTPTIISLISLYSVASAERILVRYDISYDNPKSTLTNVACSSGSNGLLSKGFVTYDKLPSWPNIGSAYVVKGSNSPFCGSCWNITYGDKSVAFTAIDHADAGFNLALQSMDTLTDGHSKEFGTIYPQARQVDKGICGL